MLGIRVIFNVVPGQILHKLSNHLVTLLIMFWDVGNSGSLWQDFGIKNIPIFSKSCRKSSQKSFTQKFTFLTIEKIFTKYFDSFCMKIRSPIWSYSVWPDCAIYWTLGKFLKHLATINLPKSLTFLGNFCKVVKIYHFYSAIILGNFYRHLAIFFWSYWTR